MRREVANNKWQIVDREGAIVDRGAVRVGISLFISNRLAQARGEWLTGQQPVSIAVPIIYIGGQEAGFTDGANDFSNGDLLD